MKLKHKFQTDIGLLIKSHREKAKLTQADLAEKLQFDTPQFVSIVERGLAPLPLNMLGKLIILLKLPEEKLVKLFIKEYERTLLKEIANGRNKAS